MPAKLSSLDLDREALLDSVALGPSNSWSETETTMASEGEGSEARERKKTTKKNKNKKAENRKEKGRAAEEDLLLIGGSAGYAGPV